MIDRLHMEGALAEIGTTENIDTRRNTLITRMPASARNGARRAPFCTRRTARRRSTSLVRAAIDRPEWTRTNPRRSPVVRALRAIDRVLPYLRPARCVRA